jgi:HPt (histidine-containing phosphotransfer) domain-containing protein
MPAFDIRALNALQSDLGDEIVVELIDLFLENSPKLLSEMEQAAAAADVEGVVQQAHALKSTSQTLGATGLAQVCRDIERMGTNGLASAARAQASLARKEFQAARTALERERTNLVT